MLYEVLAVVTILAAALMVGNELTVALFLHPALQRLPDGVYAPARTSFARVFGRIMPFWYAAVLLLTLATAWEGPPLRSSGGKLLLASSFLWLLAIVFSVVFPAPLNSRIAKWDTASLPSTLRADGQRWDRLHALRMLILLPALVCLIVALISSCA
jgi:hypothetical protein